MPWVPPADSPAPANASWFGLQPRGLLIAHATVWLAVMYLVLLWRPSGKVGLAKSADAGGDGQAEALVCVAAVLWHHRLRSGVATRLLLAGMSLYHHLAALLTTLSGGARLLTQAAATMAAQQAGGAMANATPGLNATAATQRHSMCFNVMLRFTSVQTSVAPFSWMPRLAYVELHGPPEACVAVCSAALDPGAWPSGSRGRGAGFAFDALSYLDGVVTIVTAMWTLVVAARLENARRFGLEEDYLAMGQQVRRGLRRITSAQLALAAAYAALFSGFIQTPDADSIVWRVGLLLGCAAMEVAGHSLTLVALSMLGVVLVSAMCVMSWAFVATKALLGSFFRLARLALTEATLDSVLELSLSSSKSFGQCGGAASLGSDAASPAPGSMSEDLDDEMCAICLCPLHPEVSCSTRPFTALQRLRPRFRASISRNFGRAPLVRLSRCQHAFHRCCFESGQEQLQAQVRYCCPTCRAPSALRAFRRSPVRASEVMDFLREELDAEVVGVAVVLVMLFVVSMLAVEVSTRIADKWVTATVWLHNAHGFSWPVLNTPGTAMILFQVLAHLPLGPQQALLLSLFASYPVSYAWWAAPNQMVTTMILGMLVYLVFA